MNSLFFCGDTHGNFQPLVQWCDQHEGQTLFHVGDFGIGFAQKATGLPVHEVAAVLGDLLQQRGNSIYVTRGNHDFPRWFDGRSFGGIHFVRDNTVVEAMGKKVLCIGGALSIDRTDRTLNEGYWLDEVFGWDGTQPADDIDCIVTHAPGTFCGLGVESGKTLRKYLALDPRLRADIMAERAQVDALEAVAPSTLQRWFYGHLHRPLQNYFMGCLYRGLAEDEIVAWNLN